MFDVFFMQRRIYGMVVGFELFSVAITECKVIYIVLNCN